VLAAAEIAVVSSKRGRLLHWAKGGDPSARKALELADSPTRFLSTVQIGITTVAVVAGAVGGAGLAARLAPVLAGLGVPPRLAAEVALLLVVVGIAYLTLVLGELVPKRIALHDPERLATRVAGPMLRLAALAAPLVRVLTRSTELVLRLVRLEPRDEAAITEDEIRGMIAHATETGVLEATEQQIVERLFRLSDASVEMIMTPREEIVWLDRRAEPASWRPLLSAARHARYLVADGAIDRPVGYVMVRELLERAAGGEPMDLDELMHEPHELPVGTPVLQLLELFQWSGDHIAVVKDAEARVAGVLTLTDVLAGIVGRMPQVRERVAAGVVEREDGSWLVDGLIPFDEFLSFFRRRGEVDAYSTLHAFLVARLGKPPARTDVVHWQRLRLEVVDTDGPRIDQVLVSEAGAESEPPLDITWTR
jgi:putative hemolysin